MAGFLFSCNSSQPLTAKVSGPPAGQAVTADQRAAFVEYFGGRFKARFGESEVMTKGEAGKTLVIKWMNVSKPFVNQFIASEEITKGFRDMGFKNLILTDGYKSNWNVNLKN